MNKQYLTNKDVYNAAYKLVSGLPHVTLLAPRQVYKIYGIPRGGVPAAYMITRVFRELGHNAETVDQPEQADIIVDDIIDSGATMRRFEKKYPGKFYMALVGSAKKIGAPGFYVSRIVDSWVVFPWENDEQGKDESATDVVTRMLQAIGEDPMREGLRETPQRVIKAWEEWFSGYKVQPQDVLKTFEDGAEKVNEMVCLTEIPVMSFCEHHLIPFIGVAHVAYIPDGKIVGLSKLVRLVDIYSRRLQVQERLTNQIADAIVEHLKPLGAAVVIKANHLCMVTRGVKTPGVDTITSAMRGVLYSNPAARAEFLSLVHKK